MKMQIITFGLLITAFSFTACKNTETAAPETPVAIELPGGTEPTAQPTQALAKDSVTAKAKPEKAENESDEKNEKE